jgi:hypothetical protein
VARRAIAVLLTVSLAALVAASGAQAAAPTTTVTSFHLTIPNFISCDGFAITHDSDVTRRVTTFTDESGTPTRVVTHVHFSGTLTNPQTGRSVADSGSFKRIVDVSDGSITVTGRFRVITAPDEGVLLHQTGRGTLLNGQVLFAAGPNEFNDQGSTNCAPTWLPDVGGRHRPTVATPPSPTRKSDETATPRVRNRRGHGPTGLRSGGPNRIGTGHL